MVVPWYIEAKIKGLTCQNTGSQQTKGIRGGKEMDKKSETLGRRNLQVNASLVFPTQKKHLPE